MKGRLWRMLSEIVPYTFLRRERIESWVFSDDAVEKTVDPPFEWNFNSAPVWFRKGLSPFSVDGGQRAYLKLWFGGETLVLVDGKPYGEINEYHRILNITPLADGKPHTIEAQVMPRSLLEDRKSQYSRKLSSSSSMKR